MILCSNKSIAVYLLFPYDVCRVCPGASVADLNSQKVDPDFSQAQSTTLLHRFEWNLARVHVSQQVKVSDVQVGNFLCLLKVLKTIYFLIDNNADNSNLILVVLEKQRGITLEA